MLRRDVARGSSSPIALPSLSLPDRRSGFSSHPPPMTEEKKGGAGVGVGEKTGFKGFGGWMAVRG